VSLGATLLANGFGYLLAVGGESLTIRGKSFIGLVALLKGEKDVARYDRSKINVGTRGASVIEIAVSDFAPNTPLGTLPQAGEVITDGNAFRHTVSDVVRNGNTALCYCKVS